MKVTVSLILFLLLGLISLTDLTYLPAQEGEAQADLSLLLPDEEGKILGSILLLHVPQLKKCIGRNS